MMMTRLNTLIAGAALAGALALAACGTTQQDRAISGGLLGAGAGAVAGSVTGGDAATGAVIGGLGGAAVGALTDPCTLNLGDPFWRERGRAEYERRCGRR